MLCGVWWPSWSTCSKQQQTCQFPLNRFFLPRVTAQVWHCRQRVRRFPKFLNRTESQMRHQEIRICYVEHDDQAEAPAASSSRLVNSHWIGFFYPASRHRCSTADKEYGVFPNSSTEQSCKWDSKKYGYVMWSMMTKLKHVQQAAADLSVPTEYAFFTLQEEQSLCFLKAWQSIHLGQPRITFPSPFRVAGVGRSIITRLLSLWD